MTKQSEVAPLRVGTSTLLGPTQVPGKYGRCALVRGELEGRDVGELRRVIVRGPNGGGVCPLCSVARVFLCVCSRGSIPLCGKSLHSRNEGFSEGDGVNIKRNYPSQSLILSSHPRVWKKP